MPSRTHTLNTRWLLLTLTGVFVPAGPGRAQSPPKPAELSRPPVLGRDLASALADERPAADPAPQGRTPRFRMFRMMPGFLSDPLIPDTPDDPALADDPVARALLDPADGSGPNRLQVALRDDNPYF